MRTTLIGTIVVLACAALLAFPVVATAGKPSPGFCSAKTTVAPGYVDVSGFATDGPVGVRAVASVAGEEMGTTMSDGMASEGAYSVPVWAPIAGHYDVTVVRRVNQRVVTLGRCEFNASA